MSRDFFDPTPEEQNVVLINIATLHEAERLIESYEHCYPEGAEIPFDNILDRVTGSDPSVAYYIFESPAKCPACRRKILEKTLIEWKWPHQIYKTFSPTENASTIFVLDRSVSRTES